ncbi:MAG TPA: leucyl/phenylalanyl-tRNA--protein transferase [Vicinamibacterales bacterium]|nr:leucyl/phenylalanyl-tRNA--protein transferase [Vicinamibacterales bacterium]HOQ60749.1 leucyl/phenylalanyl-tRNA--protein transferase [Vicinamibacterales bacterium]
MLAPSLLVAAYEAGYFPMAMDDGAIRWFSPDPRAVIPLARFRPSRRLLRTMRSGRYAVTVNRAFRAVMEACASGRDEGTWISPEILESYCALHARGLAHSVEAWSGANLAGGLYGVALNGAFFGESMFHRASDASKVALASLVARLRERGFRLLDVQWQTPFMAACGAVEVPRDEYLADLQEALRAEARFDG